ELERYQKKEQSHGAIVDPVSQRAGELYGACLQAERQLPNAHVGIRPWRIGEGKGGGGGQEQDAAAECLDAQEPREGLCPAVGELVRQPRELGARGPNLARSGHLYLRASRLTESSTADRSTAS